MFRKLIGDFAFMFFLGMLVAEIWSTIGVLEQNDRKNLAGRRDHGDAHGEIDSRLRVEMVAVVAKAWPAQRVIAALVLGPGLALHDILETKPLRFLGRISYSYYLYHPLALTIFAPMLTAMASPSWVHAHPFLSSAVTAIITVVVAIPLGYGSYVLTERPMIRFSRRF